MSVGSGDTDAARLRAGLDHPVIDADGRIAEALPMHAAGRIDAFIPKAHAPTLFARYGNMLPVGFALLLLALAIAFRRRGR